MEITSNKTGQIKLRQRISDHGEVFTNEREVNAMLDLVKHDRHRLYPHGNLPDRTIAGSDLQPNPKNQKQQSETKLVIQ